jgi:hypothetical protein
VPRVNPGVIRRDRAAELEQLARLLDRFGVCNAHPLFQAADTCRTYQGAGGAGWGYAVTGLLFARPHELRGIRPKEATEIQHVLDVELDGVCEADDYRGDPFTALSVDIVARGKKEGRSLLNAWHLDRHLDSDDARPAIGREEEASDQVGSEVHPLYHFHFGGRLLTGPVDEDELDLGDLLLLEPPRIMHPPMDAILAVDFLLANFYPADRYILMSENEYATVVQKSQDRFWKPYADVCAGGWTNESFNRWNPDKVWPHLCRTVGR